MVGVVRGVVMFWEDLVKMKDEFRGCPNIFMISTDAGVPDDGFVQAERKV